eukprot:12927572-Prorocentrum_lima.AAC.1
MSGVRLPMTCGGTAGGGGARDCVGSATPGTRGSRGSGSGSNHLDSPRWCELRVLVDGCLDIRGTSIQWTLCRESG